MKPIFVDTNVILRFLLNDITDQFEIAKKLFRQNKYEVVCISEVMAEVVFVLSSVYKMPRQVVSKIITVFVQTAPIRFQNKDIIEWVLDQFSVVNLAYVDLLVSKYAQNGGGEVFSFDKKLMKMQKKLI